MEINPSGSWSHILSEARCLLGCSGQKCTDGGGDGIMVQASLNEARRRRHLPRGEPAVEVKKLYICDSVGF